MRKKRQHRFVVLGGVGTIGRVVVRDLLASDPGHWVVVADFNLAKAREFVRSLRSRRARPVFADASKPVALAGVMRGADVVVNCTQHDFNMIVMRAALRAGVHYVDLGGLFRWTRRQRKLDGAFKRAGLTAVIGMGCAPGITNVLTQFGAEQMQRVDSVRIRVGARNLGPQSNEFSFPYSAQTIVEELTLKPWVFEKGKFRQTPPRGGWEHVKFPEPVGPVWVVRTRHSEVATIPVSLKHKGIKFCDFKVGFDRAFVREVMKRIRTGWTIDRFRPLTAAAGQAHDVEMARVIVTGQCDGRRVKLTLDCLARSRRSWKASAGDIDTGCPPSIVAQMIASGAIVRRGVSAPETVVPVAEFLREARQRGMQFFLEAG
jgi:saccharopine dehydrogenase-like NADP-dependent oxidoreductase